MKNGAREHAEHAGRRLRPRGVDALDHRMRMRRQHRHALALPRQRKVGDELAGPGGEALVLDAADGLADAEFARRWFALSVKHRKPRRPSAPNRW
jgi:hypothetical protein